MFTVACQRMVDSSGGKSFGIRFWWAVVSYRFSIGYRARYCYVMERLQTGPSICNLTFLSFSLIYVGEFWLLFCNLEIGSPWKILFWSFSLWYILFSRVNTFSRFQNVPPFYGIWLVISVISTVSTRVNALLSIVLLYACILSLGWFHSNIVLRLNDGHDYARICRIVQFSRRKSNQSRFPKTLCCLFTWFLLQYEAQLIRALAKKF